jgi:UDP-N-acetyl-D-mannosaminuronate dehydrogenase
VESLVVVCGMGEVGRPLFNILSKTYSCVPVDVAPVAASGMCSVLHVCYPFQIPRFPEITKAYADKYAPELIIINSTVTPGTTEAVQNLCGRPVAYSPVRGKHVKMEADMLKYRKFVASTDGHWSEMARRHFELAGFKTAVSPSPGLLEASKLVETTWLGILVGWAQDIERIAKQYGGTYEDVNEFINEIDFLPSNVFPGVIGGHCVMPNIEILRKVVSSDFLEAVVKSNEAKKKESSLHAKA